MATRTEGGTWRVIDEVTLNILPIFGDAGWIPFKVLTGSGMKKTFVPLEFNPLIQHLSPYDQENVKFTVAGNLITFLEAPAAVGVAPETGLLFKGLFGDEVISAANATMDKVSDTSLEMLPPIDPNLEVGFPFVIDIQDGSVQRDHVAVIETISAGTGTAGDDVITFFPPTPAGATYNSTSLLAAIYYRPKQAHLSGFELGSLAIQRLYDDINELWSYTGNKVGSMALNLSIGNVVSPVFNIVGIEEAISVEAGTATTPDLANPFVPINLQVYLADKDGSNVIRPIWLSRVDINYDNALGEKEGLEAVTGVSGHAENTRNVTVGINFQYESKDEHEKAIAGDSRKLLAWGKRVLTGGVVKRFFAVHMPNLKAQTLEMPVSQRLLKYDQTFKAFKNNANGSDEMVMAILGL